MTHTGTLTDRAFAYTHVVGFEETNLVGNVYYANHVRWQGRCREMFLKAHAPEVLDALADDLALVTVRVCCEYVSELRAFDEVTLEMRLLSSAQNRLTLGFEYWRTHPAPRALAARGQQEIACMRRAGDRLTPTPIPPALRAALRPYGGL